MQLFMEEVKSSRPPSTKMHASLRQAVVKHHGVMYGSLAPDEEATFCDFVATQSEKRQAELEDEIRHHIDAIKLHKTRLREEQA